MTGLQEVSHCCTQGWLFSEKLSFLRFGDMLRLGVAGAKQSEVVKELILQGTSVHLLDDVLE